MSCSKSALPRTVLAAIAALIVAAAFSAPDAMAKPSCKDRTYSPEAQASGLDDEPNAAGVQFDPRGDSFTLWDNVKDGKGVAVSFNYGGVNDRWKFVNAVVDGSQSITRNLDEGYKHICFQIITEKGPDSPIVRYTTRP